MKTSIDRFAAAQFDKFKSWNLEIVALLLASDAIARWVSGDLTITRAATGIAALLGIAWLAVDNHPSRSPVATELTTAQDAMLSEGLCPLCQSEVQYQALPVPRWKCEGCAAEFEFIDEQDQPSAITEAHCPHCQHDWIVVHPALTSFLECPECGRVSEQ